MSNELLFLGGFGLLITLVLAADLGLFSKASPTGEVSLKQAGIMSFLMVALATGFYFVLINYGHHLHGIDSMEKLQEVIKRHHHPIRIIPGDLDASIAVYDRNLGLEYLTGYVVEYALSVDNVFVILMIFGSFAVPPRYYHPVLFWGIIGAVVMRFIFIFVGASLIERFEWIMYIFGAFLLYTGVKMMLEKNKEEEIDTKNHPVVRFARKHFRVYDKFVRDKFFVNFKGVTMITPLFLVLIIIEFTDLIFAVDSIPAIFSVTKDPYIVFFSNIFAIIGLRSMFFLLAGVIHKFRFLKTGIAILLAFIGMKLLLHSVLDDIGFTTSHSLIAIVVILGGSVLASLLFPEPKKAV